MELPTPRNLPKPPKWQEDSITQFFEAVKEQVYATFVQRSKEFASLVEVDGLFRKAIDCAHNTQHWFPYLFILKAHSAFLSAVQLVMGTQAQEGYMVLRGALENALYGYYIFKHPELAKVYLQRDENDKTKKEMRDKFKNRTIIGLLKGDDKNLGNAVEKLYERVIDFGAHPNEKSLSSSLKKTDTKDAIKFEISYLTADPLVINLGLKTATQVGIACLKIAEKVLPERFKIVGLSERIQTVSKAF